VYNSRTKLDHINISEGHMQLAGHECDMPGRDYMHS
jgi:hypothetical protein